MARFLVDEDLPRSLAVRARGRGLDAVHVLEIGLRSKPDKEILMISVAQERSVVTADREFANPLLYPPGRMLVSSSCAFQRGWNRISASRELSMRSRNWLRWISAA